MNIFMKKKKEDEKRNRSMESQIIVIGRKWRRPRRRRRWFRETDTVYWNTVDYACSTPNERRRDTVLTSGNLYCLQFLSHGKTKSSLCVSSTTCCRGLSVGATCFITQHSAAYGLTWIRTVHTCD